MDFGLQDQNQIVNLDSDILGQVFLYLAVVLATFAVLFIILVIFRRVLSSVKFRPISFHSKVFLLTVPQRSLDDNENQKDIKDLLSALDNFYANLGGMRAQRGFKAWLFGRQDAWSFEIVVGADSLISFYMAVPAYLADYFTQQFLSQYPHLQIDEVEDYNIFGPTGVAAAGHLRLSKDKMFPILTYKNMEVDPLVGVLSSLSKLPDGHTAAIQFVMRSARGSWRSQGVKVVSQMQQGKSFESATASVNGGGFIGMLGKPSDWFYGGSKADQLPQPDVHRLSPMEEQAMKMIEEKASRAGLDVNIRIIAFAPDEDQSKDIIRQISNSFSQYSSYEYANNFKVVIKGSVKKIIDNFIYRIYDEKKGFVLNTEEMASLWHLPIPGTEVDKLRWLSSRRLAPPLDMPNEGLVLGENNYRGKNTLVRLKDVDRRRHMYVIGMTGTGKSWFQANLAVQDIVAGHGVCVIDPHGSLIEDILPHIPKERLDDVIIFDPSDIDRPIGLNMLEANTPQEMDFAASEMITIFYKLLPDPSMAGPMFEHYMRNALLALMADQNNPGTLVELARLFTDKDFRREKLTHVKDIMVKDFWEREYEASQKGSNGADMLSYVISKTGRFVENAMMRNIIGQAQSGINFRQVMDQKKILLINLSKGKVGEVNSNLLGLIAVSKLQMAALARADMPEDQRQDFYLYIDEFQNFITDSISVILAEARKYKLNLIMGHQYIAQLSPGGDSKVKDAIFGNVGNIISFRIGVDDSEVIAKQLAPEVSEYDVMNIEKFNAYTRLLIDNTATDTFNMHCFPLPGAGNPGVVGPLKDISRTRYGRDISVVEREIVERSKIGQLGQSTTDRLRDRLKQRQ
jgi:hypothetical protein